MPVPPRERYDAHGQDTWVSDEERLVAKDVPGADEYHRPNPYYCEVCGRDLKARATCIACGDDE